MRRRYPGRQGLLQAPNSRGASSDGLFYLVEENIHKVMMMMMLTASNLYTTPRLREVFPVVAHLSESRVVLAKVHGAEHMGGTEIGLNRRDAGEVKRRMSYIRSRAD